MRARPNEADRANILALLDAGQTNRDVARATGWSVGYVHSVDVGRRLIDVRLRFTTRQRAKLGECVISWAEANRDVVYAMRSSMVSGWTNAPMDTAVILALAEHVQAELAVQTGGEHPTMRASLYRMMGVYGAAKKLYGPLQGATTTARKTGVLPRDFWAESGPLTLRCPGWWTPESALLGRLWSAGTAAADTKGDLAGGRSRGRGRWSGWRALRKRLGYELPVWPLGGMGSLPRIDYIAAQMKRWAEQNEADTAQLYVISDFDPTGIVIANQVAEQVPYTVENIEIERLGITPLLPPDIRKAVVAFEEAQQRRQQADQERHHHEQTGLNALLQAPVGDCRRTEARLSPAVDAGT